MNDEEELNMYHLLKRLLSKDELSGLSGIVIIEDGEGYVLFNQYHICKRKNMYKLTHFDTYMDLDFFSLRNAIIYATLDKRNKIQEAKSVLSLDRLLEGAMANFDLHSALIQKTKNNENKVLYQAKLQEDKTKKKQILKQLSNYAREVKSWQFRQFEQAKK